MRHINTISVKAVAVRKMFYMQNVRVLIKNTVTRLPMQKLKNDNVFDRHKSIEIIITATTFTPACVGGVIKTPLHKNENENENKVAF